VRSGNGEGINSRDDVVGNVTDCQGDELAAVLWRHGVGYDLNALIPASGLHLRTAEYISDRGEIFGVGTLPDGGQRVFMLVPNAGAELAAHAAPSLTTPEVATPRAEPSRSRGCAGLPAVVASRFCLLR
jgi:hypothetical protein